MTADKSVAIVECITLHLTSGDQSRHEMNCPALSDISFQVAKRKLIRYFVNKQGPQNKECKI